ncbi:hypothetical protein [Chlorobaculum parvum]|nr:hypothetical protein [Chlorobaculum parvum]
MKSYAETTTKGMLFNFEKGLQNNSLTRRCRWTKFAFRHYQGSSEVSVTHIFGNQNYDAEILDNRQHKSPFSFIEVTQACEGENDHYRPLALKRDGHVSAYGPVNKSGTKATKIHVDVESIATSPSCLYKKACQFIEDAIQRKLVKPYPQETAVLVYFDDWGFMYARRRL